MKKKMISLTLALAMCLGLCVSALAIELPEGIPSQTEAQDMYQVGWNVDADAMKPVVGALKVVGDDRYGNTNTDIFCPGYWPAPYDFILMVQNISGREDCFLRIYLYFYENDGSGVYRQFDGGVAKLQNGQPMDVPDEQTFMYQVGADEYEGRDVLVALTPQVGFYLPDAGAASSRSITYSYNTWFFKLGTAEAAVYNDEAGTSEDPEAPETPDSSETPEAPETAEPPENSAVPTSPVSAVPTSSTVLVNGENTAFDAYNIEGSNYFKLRDLAYVLSGTEKQFEVGWDNDAKAISLTSGTAYTTVGGEMSGKGSGTQTATASSAAIILDGKEISLTAYNIGGNNYFKLRDIGETFDFGIGWDNASKTITIDTSTGYTAE